MTSKDIVHLPDPYRQDFIDAADVLFFSMANLADPAPLVDAMLRGRPERVVVVGMGAKGCALGTRDGLRFYPPAAMDMPIVDTNGAGDGLAVGFLTSLVLEGSSLEDAIRRGQIAARYTCGIKASTSTLITRAELERYFCG